MVAVATGNTSLSSSPNRYYINNSPVRSFHALLLWDYADKMVSSFFDNTK